MATDKKRSASSAHGGNQASPPAASAAREEPGESSAAPSAEPPAEPPPPQPPAAPKGLSGRWGMLKKMGALAANDNLDISTDNARLRETIVDVGEVANKARNKVCTVARVSSGALGQVKDVFDELMVSLTEKLTELSDGELNEERKRARDSLKRQREELEASFETQLNETVSAITQDRDARVSAAEANEKHYREEYERIRVRSSSSEELLVKGEDALKAAQTLLEGEKNKVAAAAALAKLTRETWDVSVTEMLANCTLIATKQKEKRSSDGKPWKTKQQTSVEQLRNSLEKMPSTQPELFYSDALRLIIKAYEDAKQLAEEVQEDERQAAEHALERVREEARRSVEAMEEERSKEREQAKNQLAEFREGYERTKALEKEIKSVHDDAQAKAAIEVDKVSTELQAAYAKLQATEKELAAAKEVTRQAAEANAATIQEHLKAQGSLRRHLAEERQKLADALAAGEHGGYFFSAARTPSRNSSPSRPSSPLLQQSLSSPGGSVSSVSPGRTTGLLGSPQRFNSLLQEVSSSSASPVAATTTTSPASPGSPETPNGLNRGPWQGKRKAGQRRSERAALKLNLNGKAEVTAANLHGNPKARGPTSKEPSHRSTVR